MNAPRCAGRRVPLRRAATSLCAALLLGLIMAGCSEDHDTGPCPSAPECPPLDFATGLHGVVTGDGRPLLMTLKADNRVAWEQGRATQRVIVSTVTDTTGAYTLPMPPGSYELQYGWVQDYQTTRSGYIGGDHGLRLTPEPFDVPDSVALRFDIALNEVRLTLQTPPGWPEAGYRFFIQPRTPMFSGETEVEGNRTIYHMFGLPQDRYRIGFQNDLGKLWIPPAYRAQDIQPIEVTGLGLEPFSYVIPPPGHLEGKLRGSWLEMTMPPTYFIGMWLSLCDGDGNRLLGLAPDTSGAYSFPVYAPVPDARLKIGYGSIVRWYGGATLGQSTPIDLAPGDDVHLDIPDRGIEVRMPGERYYSVVLQDSTGLEIVYLASDWYWWRPDQPDLFYASEFLPLPNLTPGTYFLRINGREHAWPTHWYRAAMTFDRATPIVIREQDVTVPVLIDSVPPL